MTTDYLNEDDDSEIVPYQNVRERKVIIQPYDYAVRTLMDMIVDGDLKLDPDYQRRYKWDDGKASRFIESISLNIPVPVIYLAEELDGSFSVIDGQQRLTSLFRFMRGAELNDVFPDSSLEPLTVNSLKIHKELNEKTYLDLSSEQKSSISKRPIRCIVVLSESDETLKFEVFERLNTGSASLSEQEIRNCIYRGPFNKKIKQLAEYHKFKELISLPEQEIKSMKDVELVLRFLAYSEFTSQAGYSDNYTEYLNMFMERYKNTTEEQLLRFENKFKKTVDLIYAALGPGKAFRKPSDRNVVTSTSFAHTKINGAIYDSQMVAVSKIDERTEATRVSAALLNGFADDDYWSSIFQGTSKKTKVIKRISVLESLLNGA